MPNYVNMLAAASIPVYNAQVPAEGPRAVQLPAIDFSVNALAVADFSRLTDEKRISLIQTLYVDTADTDSPLVIVVANSQRITVPGRTQGYYPIIAPNPLQISFACGDNTFTSLRVHALNVPIAPGQWATQ